MRRVRRHMVRPSALLAVLPLAGAACWAQTDGGAGFSVAPPPPFLAKPIRHGKFDVAVQINSKTAKPAPVGASKSLCIAGFKATNANRHLSRAQINAVMNGPRFEAITRKTLGIIFDISAVNRFSLQGHTGLELQAAPKFGPGAENARVLFSIIDTSKGRVIMVCNTSKAEFKPAIGSFRAIRATINLPR